MVLSVFLMLMRLLLVLLLLLVSLQYYVCNINFQIKRGPTIQSVSQLANEPVIGFLARWLTGLGPYRISSHR